MNAIRNPEWEKLLIEKLATSTFAIDVACYETVGSTMDVARELESQSDKTYKLVIAERQTAGRGRRGRRWEESSGALYYTLACQIGAGMAIPSGLSLAVGCVLRRTLSEFGADLFLKWPNDLLTDNGKKVSGILIESEKNLVLVGIGINLSETPVTFPGATSVKELTGSAPHPLDVAAELTKELILMLPLFMSSGFEPFRGEWLKHATLINRPIEVTTGDLPTSGVFRGVSVDGLIQVETESGIKEFAAGDVNAMRSAGYPS